MASKVPKFGAWEGQGGENYTVYFDNARKTKNGAMINPNDPQENPDMFLHNGGAPAQAPPTHGRAESQGRQQSKGPQFENARKTKHTSPTRSENERQINAPAQTRPATIKPEPQDQARSKVPAFGAWEGGGEVAYTMCFDNVRKNKTGPTATEEPSRAPPQPNRDVSPQKEARSKVPEFGAWDGGENVPYTAYFDNARKNKGELVEPQLNRDVGDKGRPTSGPTKARSDENLGQGGRSRGSNASTGRQTPGGQSPLHSKGGKPQSKASSRGSQNPEKAASIPAFGVWNTDPTQGEGFTGAFLRAREDRMTPQNNTPSSYQQQNSSQEEKKGCCFPWFR